MHGVADARSADQPQCLRRGARVMGAAIVASAGAPVVVARDLDFGQRGIAQVELTAVLVHEPAAEGDDFAAGAAHLAIGDALVDTPAEADARHGRWQDRALLLCSEAPVMADGAEADAVVVGRESGEDEAGYLRWEVRPWRGRSSLAEAKTHGRSM
jgi:hypothetical protein